MTMALRYAGFSARMTLRNTRFFVFTVALPVLLYLVYSGLYGGQSMDSDSGYSVNTYLMISMAAFGGIGAAINTTARVAVERSTGWNRQLRLTALSPQGYVAAKIGVALALCLPAIVLVFLAGATVGHAHLTAVQWLGAAGATWVGLVPFAVLGLLIGYSGTPDSIQPMVMVAYLGSSLLGGLWFPLESMAVWVQDIAKVTPGYQLGAVSRAVSGYGVLDGGNVAGLVGWTALFAAVAAWAYRRSGRRA